MAKTKEELDGLKQELISLTNKFQELNDEEIETIVGGDKNDIGFIFIPVPGSIGDITKRMTVGVTKSVFNDTPSTSTFTDGNTGKDSNEYDLEPSNQSVFK